MTRKANNLELKRLKEIAAGKSLPVPVCAQAEKVWQAMAETMEQLLRAKSREVRAELAKLHATLRQDWQVLTQTPSPGQLKQGKPRKASPAQFNPVAPLQPIPTPDQPDPDQPDA